MKSATLGRRQAESRKTTFQSIHSFATVLLKVCSCFWPKKREGSGTGKKLISSVGFERPLHLVRRPGHLFGSEKLDWENHEKGDGFDGDTGARYNMVQRRQKH